ncbi:MAG: HPF/RaiA family ribosome-associated protein [Candidatus Omnitrophica bacterium]|nr:HPF/RaiA family ribosome-associated protein [Candidatus Omnitrophota bacterium]
MKVDVTYKYIQNSKLLEEILDKNISKIDKRLVGLAKYDAIRTSIHIEKNPHRNQYFCRSHIYLPSKVIKAENSSNDAIKAINLNFSALIRQLDRLKYKLVKHLSSHKNKHLGQFKS